MSEHHRMLGLKTRITLTPDKLTLIKTHASGEEDEHAGNLTGETRTSLRDTSLDIRKAPLGVAYCLN